MLLCLLVIFFLAIWFCKCVIRWCKSIPSNLPPGPTGLLFVGSALETFGASATRRKLLQWFKKYGPIYKFYVGKHLVVVLGNMDLIHNAYVKQAAAYNGRTQTFTLLPSELNRNKLLGKNGMLQVEQELVIVQRRFQMTSLHELGLGKSKLEMQIKDEADKLVRAIRMTNSEPHDPSTSLAYASMNMTFALLFGQQLPHDDEWLQRITKAQANMLGSNWSYLSFFALDEWAHFMYKFTPQGRRQSEANRIFVALFRERFNECMKNANLTDEPTTYIEAFLKAKMDVDRKDNWTFSEDQLFASMLAVVFGSNGVSFVMRWLVFLLAKDKRLQDAVYREIKKAMEQCGSSFNYRDRIHFPLAEATIAEALRFLDLASPMAALRKTVQPSKLGTYDIPVGTIIVPLFTALASNPKYFPDPKKFDPYCHMNDGAFSDMTKEFIPFGLGKKRCSGEILARTQLFIYTTTLVSEFEFHLESPGFDPLEVSEMKSLTRGKTPFQIRAIPRI